MQPSHGIFVEQRLRHLLASGQVESRVLAPVPWFPFKGRRWGRYGVFAEVPAHERRHGIEIMHPRYPVIPKVGMSIAPSLLATAMLPTIRREISSGNDFDIIDAHYFYPDGVAAAILGRRLRKAVTITARGTDIHFIAKYLLPRCQIVKAARGVNEIIAVSNALKGALTDLGVDENRVAVLRNGVDLKLFRPLDRQKLRSQMSLKGVVLLSVGLLIERKGHHVAIEAMTRLTDAQLIIIGNGPMKSKLQDQARVLGVSKQIKFLGSVDHDKLCEYYNMADALILATNREGMPNVVLEALACGTPVIATNIGGIPDILTTQEVGRIVKERNAHSIEEAVNDLLRNYPNRQAVRLHAEKFSWKETTDGQLDIFSRLMRSR